MTSGLLVGKEGHAGLSQVIPADHAEMIRQHMELPDFVVGLHNLEQYKEETRRAEVIWCTWGMQAFSREQIDTYFPNLKALFYCAGSVQTFVWPFLEKGVRVFSAWAANAVPVSEFTLAEILLSSKGGFRSAAMYRRNFGRAYRFSHQCCGAYHSFVGLIGLGMIGGLVAEKLKAFDFHVLAHDPFASAQKAEKLGVQLVGLDELFSRCDIISNHLADNAQTRGMLNYALFSKMKPCASFINTARGAQVVEKDLARALREVKTRVALLDVTVHEPLGMLNPLRRMRNVVLTPHVAGSIEKEFPRMTEWMIEEYLRFSHNEPCRYEVTLDMLKTMA